MDHSPATAWRAFAAKKRLPAFLEAGGDALAGCALRGLADRAGDSDAAKELLLGADLAQPFVVRARQGLSGRQTCASFGQLDLGGLIGVVGPLWARDDAGHGNHALLSHVVAVR